MNLAPHPFTLRQLQYAVAVADSLSFHRAAERCHVSQPSLSAQIAALEQALGVQLFERSRRVLVTRAGAVLLERARQVLREAGDLGALAARWQDPLSGTLQIGVIPTIAPYLLPVLTPALRKAFGRLTVLWTEDKTETLVSKLNKGELDAALLALEADIGDVERHVVGADPFVLATAPDHPLAGRRGPVSPSELRDSDVLLLDDGHCFRDQTLDYCSRARVHELEFRATSLPTLAQMVAAGAGVTLLPKMAVPVEASRARLSIREFGATPPGRTIALIWRKGSPLQQALLEVARLCERAYSAALNPKRTR